MRSKRMRHTRRVATLLCGALVALTFASVAEAKTATVYAGSPGPPPRGAPQGFDLDGFYRRDVTINNGDTVRWLIRGFHTVTFSGRAAPPPFAVPDLANPVQGIADPAGVPFWFNGQPSLLANPRVVNRSGGATTDGSQYRNSGLPPLGGGPPTYTLRFTRTGRFGYLCVVHPAMRGTVNVVPRRARVPSPRQDGAAAGGEARRDTDLARRLARFVPPGNRVYAGHDRGAATLNAFFPRVKNVRVGTAVDFTADSPNEPHNVAFGPRSYRSQLARAVAIPRPAPTPRQRPTFVLNPTIFYPSDPPPALPPHTGTNHGNGFLNTGMLDSVPSPFPRTRRITFTRRGTFDYECSIHPGMTGRINVR